MPKIHLLIKLDLLLCIVVGPHYVCSQPLSIEKPPQEVPILLCSSSFQGAIARKEKKPCWLLIASVFLICWKFPEPRVIEVLCCTRRRAAKGCWNKKGL